MRPTAAGLVALCTALGLGMPLVHRPALAAPVVKVKARTEIVMEPVRRRSDGVEVRGQVVDRFNGEPVPFVDLEVQMDAAEPRAARTDGDGVFSVTFEVPDGRYNIGITFQGDEYFDATAFELGSVDVSKQSLELSVQAGDVAYSKDTVEIIVRAASGDQGAAITAELYAGPSPSPLAHVGKVTTDDEGRGTLHLDRERLGEPGRKRIQVRYPGSRAFNPAEAQSDFLLTTETTTTFTLDKSDIAYEATLSGTGRVTDSRGQPVRGGPVLLRVGSRRIAQALTNDKGVFRLRASGSEIGAGKFNLQAVFEPANPWHRGSRSELLQAQVAKPQPVPVTYTLAAFGATALAMIAFLGLRTKPWQSWLARMRPRDGESAAANREGERDAQVVSHGLQPARPSLVSTLRRPHEFDFSGMVRDTIKGRAIAGCQITLVHPDAGERQEISTEDGKFVFAELAAGEWNARASAHGYVTETFGVTIPHRGELRGARIDLLPVREQIFLLYREVAQPLLPASDLWGIWTPRQIFDYVRKERPASALSRLTDFVEETYFSQRTPVESILQEAQELVDRARSELVLEVSKSGARSG